MGFIIDLRAEGMGELFCGTATFLTQVVTLPKVLAQILIITVVLLGTVCVTEVAEVVIPAQVFQQFIIVQVAVITELTERVSSVACIIRVSMCSVAC